MRRSNIMFYRILLLFFILKGSKETSQSAIQQMLLCMDEYYTAHSVAIKLFFWIVKYNNPPLSAQITVLGNLTCNYLLKVYRKVGSQGSFTLALSKFSFMQVACHNPLWLLYYLFCRRHTEWIPGRLVGYLYFERNNEHFSVQHTIKCMRYHKPIGHSYAIHRRLPKLYEY